MKLIKNFIIALLGILIGIVIHNTYQKVDSNNLVGFERFDEVLKVLDKYYIQPEKIDTGLMLQSAVKAYVDAIDDPYTVYLDQVEQSGFKADLKGESDFEGIGAVVRKKDYYVLIEEVLKDSPAQKAGLKPLDRIVSIGTGIVEPMTLEEAVSQIRGPKGTTVELFVERVNRKKPKDKTILQIDVVRDTLIIPSVNSKILTGSDNKKIAYINISLIGEETEHIFEKVLGEVLENNIEGVILDLRGNGGGLLPVAVQIASHFVKKGDLIVSAKYRIREDEEYRSFGYNDSLRNYPIVVLVDGWTASAGEIIALALQEQVGAKIVGDITFGKGSIQTMNIFPDGASIKYTVGKRYSPSGKNIDEVGIQPDVLVEFDSDKYLEEDIDTQLQKALSIVSNM